ncbi:Putative Amidase [Aspergillus calidoustus]|uniref:Putative Amidase n=1 Tax=Aspergillus calidoustus TaxID=454130 RepID=A0A0U5GUV8_ASPCI|nr:Putative Amidase [Aspergillus calidoustus]
MAVRSPRSLLKRLIALLLLMSFVASTAAALSIVEASIEELQDALSSGQINAVQLLAKHLHRVARLDRRGPRLNAIPVINTHVFEDAQASDEYRASHNGTIRSLVEGIPFTAKDSYMIKGLPVAAGSPAFQNLTAGHDAFTVGALRAAGAIPLGKTNMPPMANGGMQRGLYGRAESPYNASYLAAAMGSGSSNGCGVSTAASMAVFGLAEETVSSGRSPASNNGLVAYTPSRGILSIRGNWPLTASADVVVPHARSVRDLLAILDVIAASDADTKGDFWRNQPFVSLPSPESIRPSSLMGVANTSSLSGKRIGIPRMFIGQGDPAAQPVYMSPSVRSLYDNARLTLERLGAIIEEVEFPLVTNHEVAPVVNEVGSEYPLPSYFNGSSSPGDMDAYAWDDFLIMVNDTSSVTTLADVDPALIFPQLPGTLPDRYGNRFGNRTSSNTNYVNAVKSRTGPINEIPGLGPWLSSLEARRKCDLEAWMERRGLDLLAWPTNGDVGREAAETDVDAAIPTWWNGVARSFGNFAIRQLGVPTVTVTMGAMEDTNMPVGITFASKAYDDFALMSYAYAFEQAHPEGRFAPPRAPTLETDVIPPLRREKPAKFPKSKAPALEVHVERPRPDTVLIRGAVRMAGTCGPLEYNLEVYVDGLPVGPVVRHGSHWSVTASISLPFQGGSPFREINVPDASLAMVVVVATTPNGRSAGKLLFI